MIDKKEIPGNTWPLFYVTGSSSCPAAIRTHFCYFLVFGGIPQPIGGQCLEQLGAQSLLEASAFLVGSTSCARSPGDGSQGAGALILGDGAG